MKKPVQRTLFALLALAVIAVLLWFGDVNRVIASIERFRHIYVLWFLLVLLAHEVVRGVLWHLLVRSLSSAVPPRTEIFAFAAGEAAKFVPTGAYVQNYLLHRATGTDFGRSSAATTLMILAEIAVGLVGVVVLGLGAWSTWLRVASGLLCVAAVIGVRRSLAQRHTWRAPRWVLRHRIVRHVLEEFERSREGAASLAHPRTVGLALLLTALHTLIAGASFYLVLRGLDIVGVTFWQAVAVTCFGLAFYVVLGSLEAAEVGALIGIGVSKSAAVSAMLVTRGLGIGGTVALALITMAVLRWPRPGRETRATATTRSAEAARPRDEATATDPGGRG